MSTFKNVLAGSLAILALASTSVASAQSYYPTYTSGSTCITLTRDLSIGSRGSDVRSLQTFLVAQNYPGSGSWMVTGYFGAATQAAVRIYQQQHGLAQSGIADAATRGTIAGCGAVYSTNTVPYANPTYSYNTYPYSYQYQNQYQYQNTYPYQYQNQYSYPYQYGTPTLTSLSPTSAAAGTVVTLYGSGFDASYNTVYLNGAAVSGIASSNGTMLSFTVPYLVNTGSMSVHVTNARGTSNALTLYVTGSSYPYYGSISLSSLSPTVTSVGASVTVYGSGFDYANNTVYVGGAALSNIASYNGTSLTFTVPYTTNGSVQVYVTNLRGTSNALTLSINGYNQCGIYPYTGSCGQCGYGPCQNGSLSISALSPQSGGVGTAVTVYGSGFSTTGNTVHFGQGIITGLNSVDGRSVSFIVPSQLTGYGSGSLTLGTYNVSVTNASGASSNSMPFTVTSLGSQNAPTISSVNGPSSLATAQTGTWTLTIIPNTNQYLTVSASWGDTGAGYVNQAAPQTVYGGGTQTVTFSHAYYTTGTYTVTFTVSNANGQSSTYTASVYVTGASGSLSLSYLSPSSGRVGTQIMISGSGFTSDNTVHFGVGGTQHVYAVSGNTLYYTIPSYISACDLITSGTYCGAPVQQVQPGTYQVYVTTPSGQSNQLSFTVTP